jgi:hypothetical protein
MMGLGAFLSNYVSMRMTRKEFELDVAKFEEAKRLGHDRLEIDRREIMARERANELRATDQVLRGDLPGMRELAKRETDEFGIDVAIRKERAIQRIRDNFKIGQEIRAATAQRARTRFEEIQIPEDRRALGLGIDARRDASGAAPQAVPPAAAPRPLGPEEPPETFEEASERILREGSRTLREKFPDKFAKPPTKKQPKSKLNEDFNVFERMLRDVSEEETP